MSDVLRRVRAFVFRDCGWCGGPHEMTCEEHGHEPCFACLVERALAPRASGEGQP